MLLEQYYLNIVRYDLINKFNYKNIKNIPELKKIVLNFGCKTFELQKLSISLLALQLITRKKGNLTLSKKSKILLKIRKGNPVGCKVVLVKKRMYSFFSKFITEIQSRNKNQTYVDRVSQRNALTYNLNNVLYVNLLEKNYLIFNSIKNLNITFLTNTDTKTELFFILNSLKLKVLKNRKCNSIGRV